MRIAGLLCLVACGGAPSRPPPANLGSPTAAIELTWIVHPVNPELVNKQDYPLAPLELKVGSEVLKLEPQMGALNSTYQGVCHVEKDMAYAYPLAPDEVAKITFFEGGAGGYLIKRAGGKLALFEWSQSDGACNDPKTNEFVPCPVNTKQARVLDVPGNVEVVQRLLVVDAAGKQAPIDCSREYANQLD